MKSHLCRLARTKCNPMIIGLALATSSALNAGLCISQYAAVVLRYFCVALLAMNNPERVSTLLFLLLGTAPGMKNIPFMVTMTSAGLLPSLHHDLVWNH